MKTSLSLKSVLFSYKYVIRSVKKNALMTDKFVKMTYSFPRLWEFCIRCETSVRCSVFKHIIIIIAIFGALFTALFTKIDWFYYTQMLFFMSRVRNGIMLAFMCHWMCVRWNFFFYLTHFMFIAFDIKKCSAYQPN